MPNELFIYGDIGASWWDDNYVTAKDVVAALEELPSADGLDVRINTYGGDVGEGLSIMNVIRAYASKQLAMNSQFKLRSIVDGFAYSAGTLIMLCADVRVMNPGSKAMVHNPLTMAYGNYKDFEKLAVEYKEHATYMAQLYASATTKPLDKWQQMMDDETYFTAAEAVKVGLATEEQKYEPLTKSSSSSSGRSILVPSSVYEGTTEQFSQLHTKGKGAYQQACMAVRSTRMALRSTEKNLSSNPSTPAAKLPSNGLCGILGAELNILESQVK